MTAKKTPGGRSDERGVSDAAVVRPELPSNYSEILGDIKRKISQTRIRAVVSANSELMMLYWEIGRTIREQLEAEKWGTKVIARLSHDLRGAHPEMKGFSTRNLRYMTAFAEAFADRAVVQQAVAQLPWGNVIRLLERVKDPEVRLWYAREIIAEGWSRAILDLQIEAQAHLRKGKALTNFDSALAPDDSELAQQTFKDPYLFDFLGTADLRRERDIEQGLVDHIQNFLVELGSGFAFVGRQVPLEIGDQTFFLDLLFYHLKLRCFVVIELKAVPFEPELLCREKNKVVVEYALRDVAKPIGVAEWRTRIVESLPDDLQGSLPTVEELEAELQDT